MSLNDIMNQPPTCFNCGVPIIEKPHKCKLEDIAKLEQEVKTFIELSPIKLVRDSLRTFDKN